MKVSVTFLLVALSCCFSPSPAFLQTGSGSQMSEQDAYSYTRTINFIMEQYQEVQKISGEDREFRTKCTLNHIINVVKELCVETGLQPLEVLQRMGLPEHLVRELNEIIQSGGSVHDLGNKKCEDLLGGLVKGLGPLLNDILRPLLGALTDILGTATKLLDSLTGGALGGVTEALGGVLGGAHEAVSSVLGGVTGAAGGIANGVPGVAVDLLKGATGALGGVGGALNGLTGSLGGLGGILGGGGKHGESKGKPDGGLFGMKLG